MDGLEDSVVVITGAAGNLVPTIADKLLSAGAKLVLVDRARDRLPSVYPQLADDPNHWLASGIDLTSPEDVAKVANGALDRFGRIDALLNIAGMFRAGTPVHEMAVEDWDQLLSVNARSAFLTARAVSPSMIDRGRGKIVNVGARPGLRAGAGNSGYAAGKSAVLRLTESLSAELKGHGINVNAVIPGTLDTEGNRQSMPKADFSRWVPLEALADVVIFLISEQARAIHGAFVPVYGLS